jgi:hypothetical protein
LTAEFAPAAATESEMAAEFEYQEFIDGLGSGNVSCTIHRYPKFGNVLEWCEIVALEGAQLDAIRENHGPGKYKLTFRGPNGFMGAKNICIAVPYDKDGPVKPAAGGNNGNGDFMREQLIMQQNMMTALITGMRGPDMGAMMAGMAALMQAMRPADNGAKPVDPLAMFQSIITMYQGLKGKEDKSPLDQIRDVAGVIKEFSSEAKGAGIETGWDALAKVGTEAIDKLSPLLTGIVNAPRPAPAVVTPGRPVASTPAPQLQEVTTGGSDTSMKPPAAQPADDLQHWLSAQLAFLKTKAQAGKEPLFWVDYIFLNPEEPGCQAILYAIRQGATFENLLSFDAQIAQNPQLSTWFRTVYDAIKSELSADVDSGGEGGDSGDVASDGVAGSPGLPGAGSTAVGRPVS